MAAASNERNVLARFVDSVHREKEQGVPLQHLGEIVNVEGFDIDSWVQPEVVKNEVGLKVQSVVVHTLASKAQTCRLKGHLIVHGLL